MSGAYKILLIIFTGLLYIGVHEFGHFIVASGYNLDHSFVYGSHGGNSLLGTALGVSHLATTPTNTFFIVFGATLLPLALMLLLTGGAIFKKNEDLALMAEVLILLIVINLIPIPGMNHIDANRTWMFLLG